MYYDYEKLYSRPSITADSEIPENLLHFLHSFGYECERRANLQLLDEQTVTFIAGNLLILIDVSTKEQRYLRSCSGGGIGSITAHPSKKYFAVAEKGNQPYIIVYEYPSLRPYRILRGGTVRAYSFVNFNHEGTVLASVGSAPDYMLTLWDWRQEEVMLRCKAISQEVYRVTFSPHNPGQLTTSGSGHIKFWNMASTFTGLKLHGLVGRYGKTAVTDIEGYVELPDGKVVSGSEWGNLLLWEGDLIKVQISRKDGRTCHAGTVQPFALDEEQLMTFGSDGAVRGWDLQGIDAADCDDDSGMFEMEPINEMVIGHNVNLSSVVKSSLPDIWFAQDSNGGIWKLNLSFLNNEPECLFSFHAGAIQGMDVSRLSYLMATTALDGSLKVFDFLSEKELTTIQFKQGGTALRWAPPLVNESGGLLVIGCEDGVVRLLELYNPQRLHGVIGHSSKGTAELRLKQAFKPHSAPVTAIAYDRNGEILATGSSDCTVFFFTVGEKYHPIGFISVPGPVQMLEWSPHSHSTNTLLILCLSGHVVEVQSPDSEAENPSKTYQLSGLPSRYFRFRSIKSRIKREEEIARRQAIKEKKKKEREEQLEKMKQQGDDDTEELPEEEMLPPIYIPDPPSPVHCAFYSQPGMFWLCMGGFDSGFLYHCKFSEKQEEDPAEHHDEPFDFLPVHNTDDDPICSVTFSYNRQLMLCGMHSGTIRVYPLQPGDHSLASMQAYWALSVHDNQYGHLQHIRCSFDDQFVLTAGDDGNIFSFSLISPDELQKALQVKKAKVPSPRAALETEDIEDIEDPEALSIEMAKQRAEKDHMLKEAEWKKAEKLKKLAELRKKYRDLLDINHSLPEYICLKPAELQLDLRFTEEAARVTAQRVREARREQAWLKEQNRMKLQKLHDLFKDSLESDTVTVFAIRSGHRVSSYRLTVLTEHFPQLKQQDKHRGYDASVHRESIAEPAEDTSVIEEKEVLTPAATGPEGVKTASRQAERSFKPAEKAEQARARIEKRKREWAQFYAQKPDENSEDPEYAQAIRDAMENMGDFKLKTAQDYTVPEHLRMNVEKKRAELLLLEQKIQEKKTEMNKRITALRDTKVRLLSQLHSQARQLLRVQQRLATNLCRPVPILPKMLPGETPEKRLCCSRATLERYRDLRAKRIHNEELEGQEGTLILLEELEREMEGQEEEDEEEEEEEVDEILWPVVSVIDTDVEPGVELTELEKEVLKEEEIRLKYMQDCLLEQMENSVQQFDAELLLLRHDKLTLDCQMKLADLRHITLFQELLILTQFEEKDNILQEKLNACMDEESNITAKLNKCNEQLELKQTEIANLQKREKALVATFQASLGKNNEFADFLTKVFEKRAKRDKKNQMDKEEEDSDEDSAEEEDWEDDEDEDEVDSCPPNCDPQLFEKVTQLHECRLDLDALLAEEKKCADALKEECDTLVKKREVVQSRRKAAEGELALINREKQQKMNDLDVAIPLRLHQIEFVSNGRVSSNLSLALVMNRSVLHRLQERIKELQVETSQERDRTCQVRKRRAELAHECKEMKAKIPVLEERCKELMMQKFGKLVDLEAVLTLAENPTLDKLREEQRLRRAAHAKEIKDWKAKEEEARNALMLVTKGNTERLRRMNNLLCEKKALEDKIITQQKKLVAHRNPFQDQRRQVAREEIERLQKLVKARSEQIEALSTEIWALSHKGGRVLPPSQLNLLPPIPTTTHHTHTNKPGRLSNRKQRRILPTARELSDTTA
ncbi:cilia- and flagella-associated protein 44 [Myripristis murdjan]|uniref:cilia- and flagella-associated protein 44 n=1 Tax=Myripristis murdjan TaxID=586833 RepID=UPI001176093A|nr:cilia- and flagella-associated protein 44 [Myripristis murdjan]